MKFYSAKISLLLIIYGSLSSILAEIDNANFLQVHRSYIVNINKVTTTTFKTLTMHNNIIIPVERKYRILLDSFFK